MSSTTPNLGLTKTTAAETIGQNWAASNDSGGNFDIIDTKMGAVGNTSLQAQVTALNSNKANKNAPISYFSLIDRVTLSKNATDYTFYNGRSLATYPTISIQPIIGGYFRQGVVIPRVHFNNPATGRFSLGYYSGGEQVEIVIAYVDDDKINMKYNATGTFTVEMIIDGLVNGSA